MNKLKDIENQLKVKQLELSIEKDSRQKQKLRDAIQVLSFRREIELIKDKIKRITR